MNEIEIIMPDDFHHHFRDNEFLNDVVPFTAERFGKVIAMPNTKPPIRTTQEAINYKSRIVDCIPNNSDLQILMTLYLTDNTTSEEIYKAKESGVVYACKLYPSGATTNSELGVTDISKIKDCLKTMASLNIPLLVHGEVTDKDIDIFDREKIFIERILKPLIQEIPTLKIVMEHITTKDAVDFVTSTPPNIGATITAHHMLYNRNELFKNGICPHLYCLPILKREEHRKALINAATSGSCKFFLGTDSAPHTIESKESACGCAGIFTGHIGIELYTEIFENVGKLKNLEKFASINGSEFYGIKKNKNKIKLIKKDWLVPEIYNFGNSHVRPLRAGEYVKWEICK
tara:strand:+ start:197 stop:1231 length:1035 start_codon:yes stop_codon:yes gene_type:complete